MNQNQNAKNMALGGVLAALAVIIMALGGMIPLSTYVCPMLCMVLLQMVLRTCGRTVAWAWYGAVAFLSVLLGPDKEAAAVFAFLGYYPILKPRLDAAKFGLIWKLLLFNCVTVVMYWLLIHLFGMDQIAAEFEEAGTVMMIVTLLLGNITFFLVDRLLSMRPRVRR